MTNKTNTVPNKNECVILLHGLARKSASMKKMEAFLIQNGYDVLNIGYPSRKENIESLSISTFEKIKQETEKKPYQNIHFITHSMGGILVRHHLKNNEIPKLGRVVMLSPPNNGSEAVDKLKSNFFFKRLNGPAGQQLGTNESSVPKQLGPIDFEAGILIGDRSINWILSSMIPGKDDGKVSVESAKVKGMKDFKVINATHPFIMKNKEAMNEALHFIETGNFTKTL